MVSTTTTVSATIDNSPLARCLRRAEFGEPSESDYLLPFPAGTGYTMFQGYCRDDTSHEEYLAYDFLMPIGSEVTASRAGIVREARDDVSDTAATSQFNYLLIEHDDGTAAFYAHLTQDGALVGVGDMVGAGDVIGLSGSSGRTGEILHFGLHRFYPHREGTDLAVNFRNAEGPLDARGGLRDGSFYRALPAPTD